MSASQLNPLVELLAALQSGDRARAASCLARGARVTPHAGRRDAEEGDAAEFIAALLRSNQALVVRTEHTFQAGERCIVTVTLDGLQSFPPGVALSPLGAWSRQAWVATVAGRQISRLELYWSEDQLRERGVIWRHSGEAAAA